MFLCLVTQTVTKMAAGLKTVTSNFLHILRLKKDALEKR